jgi:hypothetical protein
MVTVFPEGRLTIAGSLVARVISVSVGWLAFRVTVRVPVLPSVRGRTGGARLATVGGGTITVTWLWTDVPLSGPAVRVAVPGVRAVTETGTEIAPAGMVTVAGTETMPAPVLLSGTTVSVP